MARIGMAFDLRSYYLARGYSDLATAEFDRDDTIDAIESALASLGHETVRIGNAEQLVTRLAAGERWDLVFNVCEGLAGPARESQVPCILDVYGIPYTFADAGVMALCLNKGWTKAVVERAGVATPPYAVIERPQDAFDVRLEPPLFAKPIAEGTGKGIAPNSVVHTLEQLARVSEDLLGRFQQPVLVESYLPGREFTVCLVGSGDQARVLGTLEIVLLHNAEPNVYSYLNKEECEERVEYRLVHAANDVLVRAAESLSLKSWRALGCRDGGRIDVRADVSGEPCFLEANPLAGLHPAHSDLPMLATAIGMPYPALIGEIVDSACRRLTKEPMGNARRRRL